MQPLVTCLTALTIVSVVSPQTTNYQPQSGDYAPPGPDYGVEVSRPDYDFYEGDARYLSPNYSPTFSAGTNPLYANQPGSDLLPRFREESIPRQDFVNPPYAQPNTPYFNPELTYDQPRYYSDPNYGPVPQYENYAPGFTTPLRPPLQGYNPYYQPPLTLSDSGSPNIIREEEDGKHTSETKTNDSSVYVDPPPTGASLGVSPILPSFPNFINGRSYGDRQPQYYPEGNFPPQAYNPNIRVINRYPSGNNLLPSGIPSGVLNERRITNSLLRPSYSSPSQSSTFSNPSLRVPVDRNQVFGDSPLSPPPTQVYTTSTPPVLPDITLSGSPRNLGAFGSGGFQPQGDIPSLPNISYEAPGREVPS